MKPQRRWLRKKVVRGLLIAIALEVLAILVVPLAINVEVPVSASACRPPLAKPIGQLWVGKLVVNVVSLDMSVPGVKRLEPYILIEGVNHSVEIPLGAFNGSSVRIHDVVKVVRFVGPMTLVVDIGERSIGVLPPSSARYDPELRGYVFQYFYPGTSTTATIVVKPEYRFAHIVLYANESVRVGIELCNGVSCRLAGTYACNPGKCVINVSSVEPFQYVKTFLEYRCGLLSVVASISGVYASARGNAWILAAVLGIVVTVTVCIGVKKAKRFK